MGTLPCINSSFALVSGQMCRCMPHPIRMQDPARIVPLPPVMKDEIVKPLIYNTCKRLTLALSIKTWHPFDSPRYTYTAYLCLSHAGFYLSLPWLPVLVFKSLIPPLLLRQSENGSATSSLFADGSSFDWPTSSYLSSHSFRITL